MAEYEDWIEQDELETAQAPQLRAPRAPVDSSNRKSVVLHDKPAIPSKPKPKPKPPVPASRPGGAGAAAAPATELQPVGSSHPAPERRASESRLFPGVSIHSRTEKIQNGKKLEDYAMERKWPWALLGLFFMGGGVALAIFGGWCIRQNPDGNQPPPTEELDACGPGKVGGGIAMLMVGFIIVLISIWQLHKLKDHRRRFIGFKDVV